MDGAQLNIAILTDCGFTNRFGLVNFEDLVKFETSLLTGYQVAGVAAGNTDAFRKAVSDNLINPGGSAITTGGRANRSIAWNVTTADAGLSAPMLINPNGQVFTFGATGSDGQRHGKVLGDNTFGVEDLLQTQDSDWDFNDLNVQIAFA